MHSSKRLSDILAFSTSFVLSWFARRRKLLNVTLNITYYLLATEKCEVGI